MREPRPFEGYPVVSSVRENGDYLVGLPMPLARDLYDAGTPPVWGFARRPAPAARVADLRPGSHVGVRRLGGRWTVPDAEGVLGHLKWQVSMHGRVHPVTGKVVVLSTVGVLHVRKVLVSGSMGPAVLGPTSLGGIPRASYRRCHEATGIT